MLIFYKNFNRLDRTFLSIQSVRYLFPDIEIHCLLQYENDKSEYNKDHIYKLEELNVKLHFDKKKYNFGNNGAGSLNNGYYFTEMLNKLYSLSSDYEKVLMMDEDNFFTSGETIRFLINNEFDLAYGSWPAPGNDINNSINGSILCVNCKKLKDLFPLPERKEYIEILLTRELLNKCKALNLKTLLIPTRLYTDYGGDGLFTNDVNIMKKELNNKNIKYKELL
jgi:hypothetical protein